MSIFGKTLLGMGIGGTIGGIAGVANGENYSTTAGLRNFSAGALTGAGAVGLLGAGHFAGKMQGGISNLIKTSTNRSAFAKQFDLGILDKRSMAKQAFSAGYKKSHIGTFAKNMIMPPHIKAAMAAPFKARNAFKEKPGRTFLTSSIGHEGGAMIQNESRFSSFARGWNKPLTASNILSGAVSGAAGVAKTTGAMAGKAGRLAARNPGITVGGGILGATGVVMASEYGNNINNRKFDPGEREVMQVQRGSTDNSRFQNSASGITFGLHNRRHG